jgi:hypothetical protein
MGQRIVGWLGALVVPVGLLVSACGEPPETVHFASAEGTGLGLSACTCEYYDGSEDDLNLELTCTGGNATFADASLFLDPRASVSPNGGPIIFSPKGIPANYAGGAAGQPGTLGEAKEVEKRILRSITGVEFRWAEQDACEVVHGCQIDSFHLLPGALHAGSGACEDFYATQRLILSTP